MNCVSVVLVDMNVDPHGGLVGSIRHVIQHYNPESYWRMRQHVVNPRSRVPKVIRLYYLLRIKRMDAFNNASMGTDLGRGAHFESPPKLMHGLNGQVISHHARFGTGCVIYQQVTVADSADGTTAATVGNNCLLGAGSKIIGGVKVGNNVKIGANAVVIADVPDNCTVVGVPARIVRCAR